MKTRHMLMAAITISGDHLVPRRRYRGTPEDALSEHGTAAGARKLLHLTFD